MRIAMVSAYGDRADQVSALARSLGGQGHQVTVYTRRDAEHPPTQVKADPGVTVEHILAGPPRGIDKHRSLAHTPAFGRALSRRWTADRPDLVHAHSWTSGIPALAAAEELAVPVVTTFHALDLVKRRELGDLDAGPAEWLELERTVAHRSTAVTSISGEEAAELVRLGARPSRLHVVPYGVDLARFTPDGPSAPRGTQHPHPNPHPHPQPHRLLYLGRLAEHKGVDAAIRALAEVPGAELVVAGGPHPDRLDTDPDVARLRSVSTAAGVHERVMFLGRVPHSRVPALLRSADLVISVPSYEPFGLAVVEAMACGVPVVATPVGGHIDSVVDEITGVFVRSRRPDELAPRVAELLADGERRRALGVAAARRARSRFCWERVARQTVAAYEVAAEEAAYEEA